MDDAATKPKGVTLRVALLIAGLAFGVGGTVGYFKGLRDGYGQAAGNVETFVQEAMQRRGAAVPPPAVAESGGKP